jgi:pimeloyl-ACP methyl ester carboxylesterase
VPLFERPGISLYYEEYGTGFPLLLFSPGGMRSSIPFWARTPWNPIAELAADFRVIAMDQRNAGQSHSKFLPGDGWHSYTADHVALLDHLGVERCHVLGGCIGGSYCLGLVETAPTRVLAAVLQQPIGLSKNRETFYAMFDDWATELGNARVDAEATALSELRESMYGGDFVFSVTRDFVSRCPTPLLVLLGNDIYHPSEISREIVELAPHAELVEAWKEADSVATAVARVRTFLRAHTPA